MCFVPRDVTLIFENQEERRRFILCFLHDGEGGRENLTELAGVAGVDLLLLEAGRERPKSFPASPS